MLVNKKAQGLPIDMIVIAGLAVLVLVIIGIAFQTQFVGALRNIFGFSSTATPEQAEIYISSCSRYCNLIPQFVSCTEYKMSDYCTSVWNTYDIDSNKGNVNDHCYRDTNGNELINVPCSNKPSNCDGCT